MINVLCSCNERTNGYEHREREREKNRERRRESGDGKAPDKRTRRMKKL